MDPARTAPPVTPSSRGRADGGEHPGVAWPRISLVSAWNDPADPTVWSRTLMNLRKQLDAIGVSAGYTDVTPWAPAVHKVHRWLERTRRAGGAWPLRLEMRSLTALYNAVHRRSTAGADVQWLIPLSAFGTPVSGHVLTWCEMTPAQIGAVYPEYIASFGLPGISRSELRSLQRQQARLLERAATCCVASSWASASLVQNHNIDSERVKIVGYGPNLPLAPPPQRDWSTPRFLFVGRDWDRKNGDAVLRAFQRLHEDLPDAELHVEGEHPPLDYPGVYGHGRLDFDSAEGALQLRSLFDRATCFVLPSHIEPFGIVYIEAASAGLASIGTAVGGTETSIGEAGIRVDPADDVALYDAMRQLADPDTAAALGRVALHRSSAFSWAKSAQRVARAVAPTLADELGWADFL
jgi:glycosyltransferase involved in cell wall biosynthesis